MARKGRRKAWNEDETRFLNVDVDVWARFPLDDLVAAFGSKVFVHHVGPEGRRHGAHFSLAGGGDDADQLTRRLVALVTGLPRTARSQWSRAIAREFNVGIQGGIEPRTHEVRLEADTLALVARVGGRLVVTTYAAPAAAAAAAARPRPKSKLKPKPKPKR
jgi:hypothetical protein